MAVEIEITILRYAYIWDGMKHIQQLNNLLM